MYLQSIKSVKHNAAKSVNRSILKKSRLIRFGDFIVHSSMGWESPNSDERTYTVVLFIYTYFVSNAIIFPA